MRKHKKKYREPNSTRVGKDNLTAQAKALERELVKPLVERVWKNVFN